MSMLTAWIISFQKSTQVNKLVIFLSNIVKPMQAEIFIVEQI